MFTEYQIRAAMLAVLTQALTETGVTGYKVMARNPQVIAGGDKIVLLDRLHTRRCGFQGRDYVGRAPNQVFKEREKWIDEVYWQVSVIRKRLTTDTKTTETGDDVAKRLVWWLNSDRGAAQMRGRSDVPMAPVYCKESRMRPYSDNGDIHQYESLFDVRTQVLQTGEFLANEIKAFEAETHPI